MKFSIGDRVKTTVNHESAWRNGFDAPAGSAGTVTSTHPRWNSYSVLLDADPDQMTYAYSKDEVEAES